MKNNRENQVTEVRWCPGCGWMMQSGTDFIHNWGCQRGDVFVPQPPEETDEDTCSCDSLFFSDGS